MTADHGRWTAIVLAGQRPGVDRLAAHFGQTYKALVTVGGEPMLTRVVRTLSATPRIARIVVLAQDPGTLGAAVSAGGEATILTSAAGISASIKAVAGTADAPWPILVTTADHPLLTPSFVESFLDRSVGCDLGVGMVERATILAAYPDNKRTWLRFRDGAWSGANLFSLATDRVRAALDLWAAAEQDRKTAWKLFLHFGPWLALRALTRTIGLAQAFDAAGKRLGLSARLVALDDAEAAIDVDKPSDHALAEAILKRRSGEA
jgi:GTP:adenosylcobinamide-phosphate guanylyltransferase